MIPVWTEATSIAKEFPGTIESCVFCGIPTRTWHENTNNPVCVKCASTRKVSDIPEDHGEMIRKAKREKRHDREDSTRAN